MLVVKIVGVVCLTMAKLVVFWSGNNDFDTEKS